MHEKKKFYSGNSYKRNFNRVVEGFTRGGDKIADKPWNQVLLLSRSPPYTQAVFFLQ